MEYVWMKWIHVVGGSMILGSIITSLALLIFAKRQDFRQAIIFHQAMMMIGNYLFLPALALQLVTGIGAMHMAKFAFEDMWIALTLVVFLFLIITWVLIMRTHIKMVTFLEIKSKRERETFTIKLQWFYGGMIVLLLIIFYLMVFKPEI